MIQTILPPHLNAICAYFTMFPFEFPTTALNQYPKDDSLVLDPFCGRGTTNLASRHAGRSTIGIDSNPVAVAIAQAKLVHAEPHTIVDCASTILNSALHSCDIPRGDFWELAFAPDVLQSVCKLREALLQDCQSHERIALRAILLGALHGPRNKFTPSYFSNQCPRTFAPKPSYAVRFWQERAMVPQSVDVMGIISRRAYRYYGQPLSSVDGAIKLGDSRNVEVFTEVESNVGLVITSPPYYGMRTYIPDQWMRWWFLGGPDSVDYSNRHQLGHASPTEFAAQLRSVWRNVTSVSRPDATMVIRFGAINDRKVDPRELISASLSGTGWKLSSVSSAGTAQRGRRQANHFVRKATLALEEYDVVATLP